MAAGTFGRSPSGTSVDTVTRIQGYCDQVALGEDSSPLFVDAHIVVTAEREGLLKNVLQDVSKANLVVLTPWQMTETLRNIAQGYGRTLKLVDEEDGDEEPTGAGGDTTPEEVLGSSRVLGKCVTGYYNEIAVRYTRVVRERLFEKLSLMFAKLFPNFEQARKAVADGAKGQDQAMHFLSELVPPRWRRIIAQEWVQQKEKAFATCTAQEVMEKLRSAATDDTAVHIRITRDMANAHRRARRDLNMVLMAAVSSSLFGCTIPVWTWDHGLTELLTASTPRALQAFKRVVNETVQATLRLPETPAVDQLLLKTQHGDFQKAGRESAHRILKKCGEIRNRVRIARVPNPPVDTDGEEDSEHEEAPVDLHVAGVPSEPVNLEEDFM